MSETRTESSASSGIKVLSSATIDILRARGQGIQHGGYRTVSNTSYATAGSLDSEATVLIPDELDSLETLEFLEFDHTTAVMIWERFKNVRIQFPDWANVLSSAKSRVRGIAGHDITSENDEEWMAVMGQIGLTSDFQARIMTPHMRSMRLSGSLKDWLWHMFEMRYDFLLTLDDVLQARSGNTIGRESSPSATVAEDPPQQMNGHVMLLQGVARSRLDRLFHPDGDLHFPALVSRGAGDFGPFSSLYFTKNFDVAWQHAQWAQTLGEGNVVPVEILHVAVPEHLMASSRELDGDEWRRFVWANRRNTERMPDDLQPLIEYQWLIGPVCRSPTVKIEKMKSPAELEIWKLAGNQTVGQFYTGSQKMMWQMGTACVGKVWRTAVPVDKKG